MPFGTPRLKRALQRQHRLTYALSSVFVATVFFSVAAELPASPPGQTSAGWAQVDITPPLGIALGGRGGPETAASKVLDPLYAQVLILQDGGQKKFVLVSLDLVGMPHDLSDDIRTDIVHETGVDWNLVLLNASHTHSGPYMIRALIAALPDPPQVEVQYFKDLREKILTATRSAFRSMSPAAIEVFEGTSQVGINRRGKNRQGVRAMVPDPQGPYDPRVWILRATPTNGSAPAVVFSYACHPVIAYGYAFSAISADFPGAARNSLRENLGATTHVQFVQGFAGNIRPRAVADSENHRFRTSTPSDLQQAGKDLAGAVLDAMKKPGQSIVLDIAGTADRPFLPRDKPPPREFYEKLRAQAVARTNRFQVAVSDYWLRRYYEGFGFARGDAWSLGLVRLAQNQWIVHSGGEPCIEWRGKISDWLSPLNVVTFGYTQEAKAYLPTESLLPEGGYEVLESNQARANSPAPFAPGIETIVRQSLLRQLRFLQAGPGEQTR